MIRIFLISICTITVCLVKAQIPDTVGLKRTINLLVEQPESENLLDTLLYMQAELSEELKDSPIAAYIKYKISEVYEDNDELLNAVRYGEEALAIYKRLRLEETKECVGVKIILGSTYHRTGKSIRGQQMAKEAIATTKSLVGEQHTDYAYALKLLAVTNQSSNPGMAAEIMLQVADIEKSINGEDNKKYAELLRGVSVMYINAGNIEAAKLYIEKALDILIHNDWMDTPLYPSTYEVLGGVYAMTGSLDKAEEIFLKTSAIIARQEGKESETYAKALMNLNYIYTSSSNNKKAENVCLEASKIFQRVGGRTSTMYLFSLSQLSIIYAELDFEKGLRIQEELVDIYANELKDTTHINYIRALTYLGNSNLILREEEKAEQLFLRLSNTLKGNESFVFNHYLALEGLLRSKIYLEKYREADEIYHEIQQLIKRNPQNGYIRREESNGRSLISRVILDCINSSDSHETMKNVRIWSDLDYKRAIRNVATMSAYQLENSLNVQWGHIEQLFVVMTKKYKEIPELVSVCFDELLAYKYLSLGSATNIRKEASKDTASTLLLDLFQESQITLAEAFSNSSSSNRVIDSLENYANDIERRLVKALPKLQEYENRIRWEDVQIGLQVDEAAIEFFTFENRKQKTVNYIAIILKKEGEPQYLPLFKEQELNVLLSYKKGQKESLNRLYQWSNATVTLNSLLATPLMETLSGVKKVYFSPSGMLHQINLGAISISSNEIFSDRYTFIRLNSTREVLNVQAPRTMLKTAILYGGINYSMDSTAIKRSNETLDFIALRGNSNETKNEIDRPLADEGWDFLPSTNEELSVISTTLINNNFVVDIRQKYAATEESVQAISSRNPSILHFATHAFFFKNPKHNGQKSTISFKNRNHPMVRSGLILSGANYAWKHGRTVNDNLEDGILTAFEISQLDLNETELVVLSACETGLGEVSRTEGVYGLQRAFKIAGVEKVIMSLWQVPDFHTKELMGKFYKNWLGSDKGVTEALVIAQNQMRRQGYSPYYWAGFVVLE